MLLLKYIVIILISVCLQLLSATSFIRSIQKMWSRPLISPEANMTTVKIRSLNYIFFKNQLYIIGGNDPSSWISSSSSSSHYGRFLHPQSSPPSSAFRIRSVRKSGLSSTRNGCDGSHLDHESYRSSVTIIIVLFLNLFLQLLYKSMGHEDWPTCWWIEDMMFG